MNKTIMFSVIMIFCLSLVPNVLSASEPTLINTFEVPDDIVGVTFINMYRGCTQYSPCATEDNWITGATNERTYSWAFWDNYIAIPIFYIDGTGPYTNNYDLEIYNWRTGGLVYSTSIRSQSCPTGGGIPERPQIIYDGAGNLLVNVGFSCGGLSPAIAVYDVGNLGFIDFRGLFQGGFTGGDGTEGAFFVSSSTGETVEFFDGYALKLNATDGMEVENTGTNALNDVETWRNDLFDRENGVFINAGDLTQFYQFNGNVIDQDDYYNSHPLIHDLDFGVGEIRDWNRNFLNPEYLTDEGHLILVGGSDYDNFQTSTASLTFNPLFFFERDNVIGEANGSWAWADMTNLTNIIYGNSNNHIDSDAIFRFEDNKIVTWNQSTFTFSIYEVPLPTFISEAELGVNTPPTKTLDLLGIDNNGRFVFAGEFSDVQGGLIFQALTVGTVLDINNASEVSDDVSWRKDPSRITTDCPSDTYNKLNLRVGEIIMANPTYINSVGFGEPCSAVHDHITITPSDTDIVNVRGSFSVEEYINDVEYFSIILEDGNLNPLTVILFDFHNDGIDSFDNVTITALDGLFGQTLLSQHTLNFGEGQIIEYSFDIDLNNKVLNVSMWEISDYNDYLSPYDYFLTDFDVNFYDNGVDSLGDIYFNDFGSEIDYWISPTEVSYAREGQTFPDYELVATIDPSETVIEVLRADASNGFGIYRALLYATDSDLGLSYYENPFTLTWTYSQDTAILNEDEIASAISTLLEGASGGFSTLATIEGDLVTDTLFGYLAKWNIKSTASKFLIGLLIIFMFIALGGWIGSNETIRSPIVSAIGGLFGAIGGLFIVTYWGLFPKWVAFTITIIAFVIVSAMARNKLAGNGGG